jgi:membrane-bound lytic murein transglycosylase D
MGIHKNRLILAVGATLALSSLALVYNSVSFPSYEEIHAAVEVKPNASALPAQLGKTFSTPQEQALLDVDHRLSEDFQIPAGFEKRVAFWLDIYTKYDSKHYVIHHREYPWLVFDVIDATDLFSQDRARWLNRRDADNMAQARQDSLRAVLQILSLRANYDHLPAEEQRVFDLLRDVPGTRKTVFREAMKSLRTQLGQKDMFESGLVQSAPFIPMMEEVFAQQGLPKELVRIPLVESSFNIEAQSRVGARGVWQIMPGVGKSGLIINANIDERQSPLKSTLFAAKMLKQNQRALKSWPLTVTSYNHGVSSLLKAVRKLKTDDLQEIIERNSSQSFQFASANFYACFMAALRGERYSKELFPDLVRPEGMKLEKMTLNKGLSLQNLSKKIGFTISELQDLNTDLQDKIKPNFKLPVGFQIFLPEKKDNKEFKNLQSMNGLSQ